MSDTLKILAKIHIDGKTQVLCNEGNFDQPEEISTSVILVHNTDIIANLYGLAADIAELNHSTRYS